MLNYFLSRIFLSIFSQNEISVIIREVFWNKYYRPKMKSFVQFITEASEEVLMKSRLPLEEEAPISMHSKNFGFITLTGKVVKGIPEDELHSTIARRLGFGGSQPDQKAIQAGLIRFAIGDGNASFQYIPTAVMNARVKKFIQNTDEIVGTVYFDLVSGKRVVKSEEMSVDKALKTVLRLNVN